MTITQENPLSPEAYAEFKKSVGKHYPCVGKSFIEYLDSAGGLQAVSDFIMRNPLEVLQNKQLDLTSEEDRILKGLPGFIGRRKSLKVGLKLMGVGGVTMAATTAYGMLRGNQMGQNEQGTVVVTGVGGGAVALIGFAVAMLGQKKESLQRAGVTLNLEAAVPVYLKALDSVLREELRRQNQLVR